MTMTTTYTYDERTVSDLHKDAYGFRPKEMFWAEWDASDEDGKQGIWDYLIEAFNAEQQAERRRKERAIADFESRVTLMMEVGAPTREVAIKWIVESLDAGVGDDAGYVCYLLGLPYSMEDLFVEACRELTARQQARA